MGIGVRRSDMEIIRQILVMDGTGITPLRYGANLSYAQIQRYFAFLEDSRLISVNRVNANIAGFETTGKGRRALTLLDELISILGYRNLAEVELNEGDE